jgi:hypothetical protein
MSGRTPKLCRLISCGCYLRNKTRRELEPGEAGARCTTESGYPSLCGTSRVETLNTMSRVLEMRRELRSDNMTASVVAFDERMPLALGMTPNSSSPPSARFHVMALHDSLKQSQRFRMDASECDL